MASIIEMPKLSDTMTVGTLVTWLKKEGESVASGDKIAEVETDKATMEMEIFEDGVLLKQFVATGEEVAVGEPICAIGEKGEKVDAPEKKKAEPAKKDETSKKEPESEAKESKAKEPEPKPEKKSSPPPSVPASPTATKTPASTGSERVKISPLARKLAEQSGVNPANIQGTGPGGRIVRADVEAAAKSPQPVTAAPGTSAPTGAPFVGTAAQPVQEEKVVKVSNMRGAIARRLVESKNELPHFYLEIEVDVGPLLALREQVKESLGDAGRISVNDMIIKACAHALRRVSSVNASWQGETIKYHGAAHVSFAVAIDDGLITPVVFDTHAKTVFQIGQETRELAGRAKARKLKPEEFTGGTFCVSNLGMMGVRRFSAIINPPNGAILAVGTTVKTPVVNEKNEIVVGQRMSLTLSCDHRVVDGATGAEFLAALRDIIEKPVQILF